ncbi:uncharacterized protein LOC113335691 [Papaver somniferum]|uniref:uncharacterized protein LOC113335691 n=1 Tax=Papaver somniferum TaxID=3469 RepID=UPI000E6FF116|nr:uncharacterized protein LOC113335691 [Papaver somniferum]
MAEVMPEVMQQTVAQIGGRKPVVWLFQKDLTKSDTIRQHGRIFISYIVKEYLIPAEIKKHPVFKGVESNRSKKEKEDYSVTLVEPDGETSEIDFKIWCSLSSKGDRQLVGDGQPVLTGSKWNALVRKYNMVVGTKLQFWCFRKADSNELCFAMNNNDE